MKTPYIPTRTIQETGLKIGCLAKQSQPPHHDRHALRIQDALLGNAARPDWDGVGIVLFTLIAIGSAAWMLA